MAVLIKNQVRISYTARVIFPRIDYGSELCLVREWTSENKQFMSKWKIPGGGVKASETQEQAAGKEILEETDQRISDPTERIFVVHKPPKDNSAKHHHDIFFKGAPPLSPRPLVPRKGEIAEAVWMRNEDVKRDVWKREFVPHHAAACLWYFVRDWYLKTGDERVLRDVLSQMRYRAYSVDENGVLAICCDDNCEEVVCVFRQKEGGEKETGEKEKAVDEIKNSVDEPDRGRTGQDQSSSLLPSPQPAPPIPQPTAVAESSEPRTVRFVLISRSRFEDYILLKPAGTPGKFVLPSECLTGRKEVASRLKEWTGQETDFSLASHEDEDIVIAECTNMRLAGFEAVSLNAPPPSGRSFSFSDMASIRKGLTLWAKQGHQREYAWIHPAWRGNLIQGFDFGEPVFKKPDKGEPRGVGPGAMRRVTASRRR